jgi:prepilin-type N-terminal cleavage/methylation domain-containing protein
MNHQHTAMPSVGPPRHPAPALAGSPGSDLRGGFTLIELLVVIAIISIIAGFLVPTLLRGREGAYQVQCGNNLKQIYTFAMSYSDKKGTRAFPIASGQNPRAHESLNEMIEFDREGVEAGLFFCPSGEASKPEPDENGQFVLDENTCAYAWVAKRTKNTTANKPLASDKYMEGYEDEEGQHSGGHPDGVNVLMTDNRVQFTRKSELPEDTMLPAGLTR